MTTHTVITSTVNGRQHLDIYRDQIDQHRHHPIICAAATGVHIAAWANLDDIPDDDLVIARHVHEALATNPDARVDTVIRAHRLGADRRHAHAHASTL